jgi:lysophospholipase L1-like esterase
MASGPGLSAGDAGAGPGHAHHEPHAHEHAHDHGGLVEATHAIGREGRRRKLRSGLLVSLFTVALATLGVELFLRVTHQRERSLASNVSRTNRRWIALTQAHVFEEIADPVRRYAMRPLAECTVDGLVFRVSSHRTRGPDFPLAKPANEKRLLCLGDSFAFGLWCSDEETLVGQLARMAQEREDALGSGITWRAIDLGVPGYHSGQQRLALEQDGLALAPDVVVLYYNTNDIEQSGFYYDDGLGVLRRDYLPLPVPLKRALWHWSHLYGWIASRHVRAVESGPTPFLEPRVPFAHVRADNQAYTREAIAGIARLCRERGIPLFFVDQPLFTFLGGMRAPDWPVLPLVQWAESLRAELGLPGYSLLGWMRGYSDGVDRFAEGAPPDSLTDLYIADEEVQEAVRWARERVHADGRDFDALSFDEQAAAFAGYPGNVPQQPDFHLTGAGYGHIARLVYPHMQAEGLLP